MPNRAANIGQWNRQHDNQRRANTAQKHQHDASRPTMRSQRGRHLQADDATAHPDRLIHRHAQYQGRHLRIFGPFVLQANQNCLELILDLIDNLESCWRPVGDRSECRPAEPPLMRTMFVWIWEAFRTSPTSRISTGWPPTTLIGVSFSSSTLSGIALVKICKSCSPILMLPAGIKHVLFQAVPAARPSATCPWASSFSRST